MYVVYVCRKVESFASQLKCGLRYYNPRLKQQHTNTLFLGYRYNILIFIFFFIKNIKEVKGSAGFSDLPRV